MERKGMSKLGFIIGYVAFIMFVTTMTSMSSVSVLKTQGVNTTELGAPQCNPTGWGAIIDAVVCGVNSMGFFFYLMTIDSSVSWISRLIFIPLSAGVLYIVVSLLRG